MQNIDAQLKAASERRAETARLGRNAEDSQGPRRRLLEQALAEGLRRHEFALQYQPLVDIASRRVVSLEALLRWNCAELGPVSPAEFIPIAEETGLIVPIGEFVLRAACQQVVRWEQQSVPVVPVAVNFSGVQLEHRGVWELVRSVLRETHMQPHRLALELTESSTDEAIVSAILAMTRSLGLRAVAEGVETPAQLEVLGRHGCEVAQGFYFCRPLPADQCRELLVELAERTSYTDTLRLRINPPHGTPRLALVEERGAQTGIAK